MNTIQPLQRLASPAELNRAASAEETPGSAEIPFRSLFEDAAAGVRETDAGVSNEIYKLATGQAQNLHDVVIASQKASLSVSLMVELRNKALDAYKELMNMSV
ncbi:MAG TPA: flagellar hook-basal body complex protein FliE [Ruminococcaceae bacterium]|jgi:flagellar hook-basal body complex protein FliE|nr:flagellar hook-basal body complex protein FliE [Oscillospiraceae bacterium]HBQ45470.1 flagellar hook-basal body complex protein FliE [Oscillospiraceae bacterium]HBT91067.1 flagellar hook-basal body complex protein FliE [Oscillospiraceae bacterium]HCB91595.1 flagellar hook-basal body complex protein FliE [Oscillospiraceae bacterium]